MIFDNLTIASLIITAIISFAVIILSNQQPAKQK